MKVELNCVSCGQKFFCYQSEAEKGRKYCSVECRGNHLHRKENAANRIPVNFTCRECGKPFVMMASYLKAYRKKFGRDPLYCSIACGYAGRRRDADERNKFACLNCGKITYRSRYTENFRIYRDQKYCSKQCWLESEDKRRQERLASGHYTKHTDKKGYVWLTFPRSEKSKRNNILEHRYVMEQNLGRKLHKHETVHHKNGQRGDNNLENLELRSSMHGPGQTIQDKIDWAIKVVQLYPEFAEKLGAKLVHSNQSESPIE